MNTIRKHDHAELPDGWRMVRLGDVVEVNPRRPSLDFPPEGAVTFLPMSSIAEDLGGIDVKELREFREVSKGYTYFEEYDVLFAKITPCLQNGKHALAKGLEGQFGFGTTEFHVVRAGPAVDHRFLFKALTQPSNIEKCVRSFSGTAGQQRVQPEVLRALRVLLPSLPEQRAIADVLGSIDEAIERTEAVIAATGTLRDSLLHELLTRGVPGWHTEWKDVPGIGTIPADWDVVRFGEVADVIMGQSPPGEYCNRDGQGVPLLNGPTEYGVEHPDPVQWTTDPKKMSRERDILFCVRGATAGRMNRADRDYAIGRGVAAIRHQAGPDYQRFIRAIIDFKMPELSAVFTGSTFPNLSYDDITGLRVSSIPIAEQRAIADVLDSSDETVGKARAERNQLQLLKASTADALLTGKLQIRK